MLYEVITSSVWCRSDGGRRPAPRRRPRRPLPHRARARHDRKVAIKVLKPELAAVLGAERFVQEIKTTAALSHPHILPLFDSGEAGGFLYYVMPYLQGETIVITSYSIHYTKLYE